MQQLQAKLYSDLISLAALDPDAFRRRISDIFTPPVEDYRALAALQAWQHSQVDALPLLAEKLTDPNSSPSLRSLSQELLEPYCQSDGRARQAMLDFLATKPADPDQRMHISVVCLRESACSRGGSASGDAPLVGADGSAQSGPRSIGSSKALRLDLTRTLVPSHEGLQDARHARVLLVQLDDAGD
ncbi:MAG: hypothetical protein ACYTG5_12210, partial [Planctomycetota bacterium]